MSKPYITSESDLRHTGDRLRNGHIDAAQALQIAFRLGAFAIGTAQTRAGREPRIPLTVIRNPDGSHADWMPHTSNESGIVVPVVRFGRVVGPVVLGAFITDPNTPTERFARYDELHPSRFIVSPGRAYNKGSAGWAAKDPTGTRSLAYNWRGHRDFLNVLAYPPDHSGHLPDSYVVGDADMVIPPDTSPMWATPNEPGHFSTPAAVVTLDSWPIRAGDVRALGRIRPIDYQPIIL